MGARERWLGRVEEAWVGARLLRQLPRFLRHPLGLEEARSILRQRLERRETDFLHLVRGSVFAQPASPYAQLLACAGCEYGDLEALVRSQGLEGALQSLHDRGVYLTVDEFKGRRPAVRGSMTLQVDPRRLRNPRSTPHLLGRTSGSRGAGTPVPMDLAFLRDRAVNALLTLDAQGGADWEKAVWADPGACLALSIRFSGFGPPVSGAFSLVDPASAGLDPRYRWSARMLRWSTALAGRPLPPLEYAPVDEPLPVLRWLSNVLRAGRTPHLWSFVSPAVRLCREARRAGIDLRGARLTVTGEPVTATRLAALQDAGVVAAVDYGSAESGFIAYGCLAPEAPDDVHVFDDVHAVIQPAGAAATAGLASRALLVSSIRSTSPIILLNVSLGDVAEMGARSCGCPLERLGWATHLQGIRSFEKLTAGGMSFLDADVIPVLEDILPARFGGGPTDYQVVEEEAEDGQPRVRLLVSPALGPLDDRAVRDAFLAALGPGRGAQRVMAQEWQAAGIVRVERRTPFATANGKILHVHRAGAGAATSAVMSRRGAV